jgi:hypothetical protein
MSLLGWTVGPGFSIGPGWTIGSITLEIFSMITDSGDQLVTQTGDSLVTQPTYIA